jgi:DNA-binding transcriptional MerR regulator
MRYALAPTRTVHRFPPLDTLDLSSFARAAGLHPELVRRLVALGLLEPERDEAGALWFPPEQLSAAARIQRIRSGLCVNYAALGLIMDLLDRIDELESLVHRTHAATGG